MRYLVDAPAFLVGYVLVSLPITGGGIVHPVVVTRGDEPTYAVLACVLAGLLALAAWRIVYRLVRQSGERSALTRR